MRSSRPQELCFDFNEESQPEGVVLGGSALVTFPSERFPLGTLNLHMQGATVETALQHCPIPLAHTIRNQFD